MANLNEIAKQLVNLTVKEANELCEILKKEHGIEPVAAAPFKVPSSVVDDAKVVEEKTEFDLILKGVGSNKLAVVKLIKELMGIGLKEAKELVDNAPSPLKEKLSKEVAETMKKQLEEVGAEIELK